MTPSETSSSFFFFSSSTTYPARSSGAARLEALLLNAARVLAALHALVGLAGLLAATVGVAGYLRDRSDASMAGVGLILAAGLALTAVPLLVLSAVAVWSRRPLRVHVFALAAGVWVVAVVVYTFTGGPASWLVGTWILFVPAFPVLAVPTAALVLVALGGLVVRRAG